MITAYVMKSKLIHVSPKNSAVQHVTHVPQPALDYTLLFVLKQVYTSNMFFYCLFCLLSSR